MSAAVEFRRLMAMRRQCHVSEREWITRAARNIVWIMRGVPASEWTNV